MNTFKFCLGRLLGVLFRWETIVFFVGLAISLPKLIGRANRFHGDLIAYYLASRSLLAGRDPYQETRSFIEYLYPPFFAFLLTPLSLLSPVAYAVVWGCVIGLCWIWTLSLVHRLQGRSCADRSWLLDILPTALVVRSIINCWGHGQLGLLIGGLVLMAMALLREERIRSSALCLALAGGIKVYPLYLGLMYLVRRSWVAILWLILFSLIVWMIPALEVGLRENVRLVCHGFFSSALRTIAGQTMMPEKCAVVASFWRVAGFSQGVELRMAQALWVIICTVILLSVRRRCDHIVFDNLWLSYAMTTMLIASPMVQEHYLLLLLFPFASCLHLIRCLPPGHHVRRCLIATVVVAGGLLNFWSPWIVGSNVSSLLQAHGAAAIAMFVFWVGLGLCVRLIALSDVRVTDSAHAGHRA